MADKINSLLKSYALAEELKKGQGKLIKGLRKYIVHGLSAFKGNFTNVT